MNIIKSKGQCWIIISYPDGSKHSVFMPYGAMWGGFKNCWADDGMVHTDEGNGITYSLAVDDLWIEQCSFDVVGAMCERCGQKIDPEYCHCGDRVIDHTYSNHSPVPLGCDCGRIGFKGI